MFSYWTGKVLKYRLAKNKPESDVELKLDAKEMSAGSAAGATDGKSEGKSEAAAGEADGPVFHAGDA